MDRRDNQDVEKQKQVFGPSAAPSTDAREKVSFFVEEEGNKYRLPYQIIKKVTFRNLNQAELKDIPYSARLQYRLLLFDAVIKAKVDYHKKFIRIIYNPVGADNIKEKISREQLIEFMKGEGVTVSTDPANMKETDYDYYKEMYAYAYFSPSIREAPPYGWTKEQWKKEKADKEKKKYRQEHPNFLDKLILKVKRSPAQKGKKVGMSLHP
jgi:hypothetical protein